MIVINMQYFGDKGSSSGKSGGAGGAAKTTSEYDIEDRAEERGYNSAEEMVQEDLTAGNDFYTRDNEMVADVEDLGYEVISAPNGEYFVVRDSRDDSDSEFIVYYETAGTSRYITKVEKA